MIGYSNKDSILGEVEKWNVIAGGKQLFPFEMQKWASLPQS